MMLSPQEYVKRLHGASYQDLITERRRLLELIYKFERDQRAGKDLGREAYASPSPTVRYQRHLLYLAELCTYMQEKYNREFVWGGNTLAEPQPDANGKQEGEEEC